jgi:hypothetical protein
VFNEHDNFFSSESNIMDDKKKLKIISKKILNRFKKMHLQISNLSDLFKDCQGLLKNKKKELSKMIEMLYEKEELLNKVVQPNNDFGTIMKSFVEENVNEEAKNYILDPQRVQSNSLKKSNFLLSFNDNDEDKEDKALYQLKNQNKRLLEMVRINQFQSL